MKIVEEIKKSIVFNQDWKSFLRIKVQAKMPKNEIFSILEDWTIKIRIKWIAEKWKANAEIIKFLKKEFEVSDIEIISWKTDSLKLLRLKKIFDK